MQAGYSKLLVGEIMLPPSGVLYYNSIVDINVMSLMGGSERTEQQWVKLLTEGLNLRVVKVWKSPHAPGSIIEAELGEEGVEERDE